MERWCSVENLVRSKQVKMAAIIWYEQEKTCVIPSHVLWRKPNVCSEGAEGRRILSIKEAMEQYSDYVLYLTLADHNLEAVYEEFTEHQNVPS